MTPWGQHLILDCAKCNIDAITNKEHIYQFIKTLVQKIDMIAYGEPQIELLLQGHDNEGYSVLQMITTSNITAHFVSKTGDGYIDVFSCKSFDENVVKLVVEEFFKPATVKDRMFYRNA